MIASYPGATPGSIFGAAIVVAASVWWFRRLTSDSAFQTAHGDGAAVSDQAVHKEE